MEVKSEFSIQSKHKLTHSKSLHKPVNLEPLILSPRFSTEPDFCPKTPKPRLQSKSSQTKQNLLEMIGAQDSPKSTKSLPGLKLSLQSSKISLTDFMGKNKFALLKQTGMMDFFHDFRRSAELLKMIDKKNIASFNNMMHHDSLREFCIKQQKPSKSPEISPFFEKQAGKKMKGFQKIEKVDKIDDIIGKCDEFFQRSKEQNKICKRHKQDLQKILTPKNRNLKKVSGYEKGLLRKVIPV